MTVTAPTAHPLSPLNVYEMSAVAGYLAVHLDRFTARQILNPSDGTYLGHSVGVTGTGAHPTLTRDVPLSQVINHRPQGPTLPRTRAMVAMLAAYAETAATADTLTGRTRPARPAEFRPEVPAAPQEPETGAAPQEPTREDAAHAVTLLREGVTSHALADVLAAALAAGDGYMRKVIALAGTGVEVPEHKESAVLDGLIRPNDPAVCLDTAAALLVEVGPLVPESQRRGLYEVAGWLAWYGGAPGPGRSLVARTRDLPGSRSLLGNLSRLGELVMHLDAPAWMTSPQR